MNQKKIENKFYAAAPGKKARFATMNEVEQRYQMLLRRVQNSENEQGGLQWLGDIKDAIQNKTESPEVLMAEIKDVERRMGFAPSGAKAKMARNSEFDTDEVKNILHKESRDAEWGIDREAKGQGLYTYSAYHAYIGERVFTKRFNTRGEAERWLEKQNAAGHPNKRKHARPGAKAKFESPKNKILAELKDLLVMLKQVKADRDDIAIVADSIKFVEKSNSSSEIGQVYRNAMDIERQYFSRLGTKAKFAGTSPEEWDASCDRDYLYVVDRLKSLVEVCGKKRAQLVEVETKTIPLVMEMVRKAKAQQDVRLLESAMSRMTLLDKIRQSFARPGAKAKFAWQPEINGMIRKVNASIDSGQARLREAAKLGKWNNASAICKNIGAMYSGNGGLATHYENLQVAADKEWRSK